MNILCIKKLTLSMLFLAITMTFLLAANQSQKKLSPSKGLELVRLFYSELLSDKKPSECLDLFDTSLERKDLKKKTLTKKWEYLKANKSLFFTENNSKYHSRSAFFKKARKSCLYFNVPVDDEGKVEVARGHLVIILSRFLSRKPIGVWKNIEFPIFKEDGSGEAKIGFYNIKINGVLLDSEGSFLPRDFDLLKKLGFNNK